MGLASVGAHKLGGVLAVGTIFQASIKIGQNRARSRSRRPSNPLNIIQTPPEVSATEAEGEISL